MTTLFLTGMFRSGSTMLARALNAHPQIAFASDPYMEVFKVLRSHIAVLKQGRAIPFKHPLSDYYFNRTDIEMLHYIQNADLDMPFDHTDMKELLPILRTRCDVYSANLTPFLDNIKGSTYAEILQSMLDQIRLCYGNMQTRVTGFKEVWTNEFATALLRARLDMKVIVVQRDPRAVCASKNAQEDQYPWHFLSLQWRKLAALGWDCAQDTVFGNRVMLLCYEDFIRQPEKEARRICAFLDIDWDPALADPSQYRDGDGSLWKQNTSYGEGRAAFDTGVLDKWKKKLGPRETAFIEYLCGPEMELYGYARTQPATLAQDWIDGAPRIADNMIASWMKELVRNDEDFIKSLLENEMKRDKFISGSGSGKDTVEQAFLSSGVFNALRAQNEKEKRHDRA